MACAAALLFLAVTAAAVRGEDAYEVEPERAVSLRALLDLRLVRAGEAPSWMERGPGKTRYGGVRADGGDFERVTRFAVSQFALESSAVLPWDMVASAQLNWEADVDDRGVIANDGWPRLIEGILRREWGGGAKGWGVQGGVMNAPFSLESDGPAWTPEATLTPSAITSWMWEEGRIVGAQADWWRRADAGLRLSAVAGAGWGPDQMGILIERRGWVLDDFLAGVNSTLPLPESGKETHVFDERDGRPALYAGLTARDPWRIGAFDLGYFDNLGNLGVQGVWETRYGVAGAAVDPLPGLETTFQYLLGKTAVRTTNFDSTFSTWYALVSYRYRGHRVSARYDDFRVHDREGPPSTRERGHAVTVAYLFEFWLRHRLAFEYIWVDSERPDDSVPDPSDDGFQLSYRFRY